MMLLNRQKPVWGPDADEFNPDRFKDSSLPLVAVPGLWGDVSTFINGPYSCM
jgi:cytochrome P450